MCYFPFVKFARLENVDVMYLVVWILFHDSNNGEEARRNGFEKINRGGYMANQYRNCLLKFSLLKITQTLWLLSVGWFKLFDIVKSSPFLSLAIDHGPQLFLFLEF